MAAFTATATMLFASEAWALSVKPEPNPNSSATAYTQSISCYGAESTGITASGAYFDGSSYTAAHPWYPFGTVLRLTHHGRSVVVVVNDRSPYPNTWDASMAACSQIDMLNVGRDYVQVQVLYMPGS